MRRPSFTTFEAPPSQFRRKSGSDYKPSSSSHASSSSSLSSSEANSSSDEVKSGTMDPEQPLVMAVERKKHLRARFGDDSSDDDMSVNDGASGSSEEISRHGHPKYTQSYQKPTKTRIGIQGSSTFTCECVHISLSALSLSPVIFSSSFLCLSVSLTLTVCLSVSLASPLYVSTLCWFFCLSVCLSVSLSLSLNTHAHTLHSLSFLPSPPSLHLFHFSPLSL